MANSFSFWAHGFLGMSNMNAGPVQGNIPSRCYPTPRWDASKTLPTKPGKQLYPGGFGVCCLLHTVMMRVSHERSAMTQAQTVWMAPKSFVEDPPCQKDLGLHLMPAQGDEGLGPPLTIDKSEDLKNSSNCSVGLNGFL